MTNKKIILFVSIVVLILLIVMTMVIPAYLYRQSDDLLTINYVCTTGLKPDAFSAWKAYNNGTHTIDMDSCVWIKNVHVTSAYNGT